MTVVDDDFREGEDVKAKLVHRFRIYDAHDGEHFALAFHTDEHGEPALFAFPFKHLKKMIVHLQRLQDKLSKRRDASRH